MPTLENQVPSEHMAGDKGLVGRAGSRSIREEEGQKFREAVAGRGGSAKKPLKLYWQRSRIVWEGGWKAPCDSWDLNAVVCSSRPHYLCLHLAVRRGVLQGAGAGCVPPSLSCLISLSGRSCDNSYYRESLFL